MALPEIKAFFDEATSTITYLVWDGGTGRGIVIDPVLDFDPAGGEVDTSTADVVLAEVAARGIVVEWVLETHVHADHLSAAPLIRSRTGARVAIGEHIRSVQTIFRPIFNADDVRADGGDFDLLLTDGQTLKVGDLEIEVMHTPGHTPADVSYRIGDAVFVGDTLFMPDYGTARADFPGGDARQLYRSVRRLLALPDETRLFMCHDYLTSDRKAHAWETTVGEQKRLNVHVHDGISEDAFVAMRVARDASLAAPRLLLPSIQVNMRAGRLPPAAANGVHYLLVPLKNKGRRTLAPELAYA
jgi:glyoxylase-like metal-dependent hydrolase (beta-lactamase superfamily II)